VAARVLWNQPEDAITARGHMLLRVLVDGQPYLADVGFGGQTLTGPLQLVWDQTQQTPHEPFRIVQVDDFFKLQSLVGESWKTLYRFGMEEQYAVDYGVTNYYLSTHPASHFVHRLMAARTLPGLRYALLDNQLTIHHLRGASERRVLQGADELRQVLEQDFGIAVPSGPEVDERLARLSQPT
jgi:N-hydroxyarylamine O-acetyltransferase